MSPGRPIGNQLDLFSFDYPEFNRDVQIRQAQAITFSTELYSTADRRKVWSINTLSVDKSTAEDLIAEQVFTIATQLRDDDLLGP